jgi:hypothetical protein
MTRATAPTDTSRPGLVVALASLLLASMGAGVALAGEPEPDWEADLAPQLHLSLNRRQHVRLSLGARVPVTQTHDRPVRGLLNLLWDWYDGGLAEGW